MNGPQGSRQLSAKEIESIAERAAERGAQRAVQGILIGLGIDVNDPIALQGDFKSLRDVKVLLNDPESIEDRAHLRRWRKASEKMGTFTMAAFISTLAAAFVGMMWAGYQAIMGQHHT